MPPLKDTERIWKDLKGATVSAVILLLVLQDGSIFNFRKGQVLLDGQSLGNPKRNRFFEAPERPGRVCCVAMFSMFFHLILVGNLMYPPPKYSSTMFHRIPWQTPSWSPKSSVVDQSRLWKWSVERWVWRMWRSWFLRPHPGDDQVRQWSAGVSAGEPHAGFKAWKQTVKCCGGGHKKPRFCRFDDWF